MSILPELASHLGRKDEQLNKALGKRLVETVDLAGIQEAAANLSNPNRDIQVDCLSVLEQVGMIAPDLIEDYLEDFFALVVGNDNRLIWQAMINLAMIADRKASQVMDHLDTIMELTGKGSVITRDNGIKILARAGSSNPEFNQRVFPFLIDQLNTCRPKSVAQYAESILVVVNQDNQELYLVTLKSRLGELSPAQLKRVLKIIRSLE